MKRVFSIIKYLIYTVFTTILAIYAVLFILLNTSAIQQEVKRVAEKELSKKIATPVSIGRVAIEPFRKVACYDIAIVDQKGDTLLYANKLLAGIKPAPLLHQRLVFNNIQLFGFDIQIDRETPTSPPNYQYIVDAFTPKERKTPRVSVQLNNVVMRRGSVRYDVLSEPHLADSTLFDKNHIALHDVLSTISVKEIGRDSTNLYIKRLSLKEQSGVEINKLSLRLASNQTRAMVTGFDLRMPHSTATLDTLHLVRNTTAGEKGIQQLVCNDMAIQLNLLDMDHFIPNSEPTNYTLTLTGGVDASKEHLSLSKLRIKNNKNRTVVGGEALLSGDFETPEQLYVDATLNTLYIDVVGQDSLLLEALPLSAPAKRQLSQLGTIQGKLSSVGYLEKMQSNLHLATEVGEVNADMLLGYNTAEKVLTCMGDIGVEQVALDKLLPRKTPLQHVSATFNVDAIIPHKGYPEGDVSGVFTQLGVNNYQFDFITLQGSGYNNQYQATVEIDDPHGFLHLDASFDRSSAVKQLLVSARGEEIEPQEMGFLKGKQIERISFDSLYVAFTGTSTLKAEGLMGLDSINIYTPKNEKITIDQLQVAVNTLASPQEITIASDFANGYMRGDFSYPTLANSLQRMAASVFPATIDSTRVKWHEKENNFDFQLALMPQSKAIELLNLPFDLPSESTLKGSYDDETSQLHAYLTLPHIALDSSRFEDGSLVINIKEGVADMRLAINYWSKKQRLSMINLKASAAENWLTTQTNWSGNRLETYCGEVRTETTITGRNSHNESPTIQTVVKPTKVILNDMTWNIKPATITVKDRRIQVDSIEVVHSDQYVRIDGVASPNEEDELLLSLQKINLGYVFDIINTRNVDFGGVLSGDFTLKTLFDTPSLQTDSLHATSFAYNDCELGELTAKVWWQPETKGIWIDGTVAQEEYPDSKVLGALYFAQDSLNFNFDAYHIDAGFMRPFVQTIFQDVSGYGYGKVNLYGNFKALNVVGEIYAQDMTLGIEFLNTSYSASDTIRFTENSIEIDDITIFDKERHTAKAKGVLKHRNFKEMVYDFNIYNAHNLLVFDVSEEQNPVYFGRAYGSGTASITGNTSHTNIEVSLRSDANTVVSFIPNNILTNNDYQFITFVDKSATTLNGDSTLLGNTTPAIQNGGATEVSQSTMSLNLQVEATPLATMRLVLDPATGDVIRAVGNGNMRLTYATNSDIGLFGSYELEKGDYTFSLQDFVSRDFSISEGSTISFKGDPMQAILDIKAIYSTTASLLDLDESFADEAELTRTSVPVQTVLGISGDLWKPELAFDMEFPTLSQNIESKVNNIINTDDMMNRQIIYMLALGRFYTPNYVNTGENRSNELASMASSTLSSQLSNMLGQISDSWDIGTSIRSDKGDFSDVEVELALSSQLLNDRLIFNGNIGYSERNVSSNSFIGDFDLEYLLNKSGNVRLKAYNHYNDRNYYTKSDLTTQGVGVLVKRDFNHFSEVADWVGSSISNTYTSFVRWIRGDKRKEKRKEENLTTPQEQQ